MSDKPEPSVGTADFIEDAMDSLHTGQASHMLIAANFGGGAFRSTCCPSLRHLRWFKRRFDELFAELEVKLQGTQDE